MSDLIERQDAIFAVVNKLDMIDHVPQWVFDQLTDALNGVPSKEPEQKWIPASELPETSGMKIVTIKTYEKYTKTYEEYVTTRWFSSDPGWEWEFSEDKIMAWMPLPEPYRGEKDE